MNTIYFIGQIEDLKMLSGPGNVLYNITTEMKDIYSSSIVINTYSQGIKAKFVCLLKILSLVFKKDCVINVHTFGYLVPFIVYMISILNTKNKYYLTLHGIITLEKKIANKQPSKKEVFLERKLIKNFPNIIVVSNYLKNYIKDSFGRDDSVYVIRNGINSKHSLKKKIDDEKINFLLAGGIFTRKGILETLSLLKELDKMGLKVGLDIFGGIESDYLYNQYTKMVKDNDLVGCVVYHGKVSHLELLNYMSKSSYCICLSKFDTFNLTILESLSIGTPVIVSDKAGVSEIITNDCGLIVMDNTDVNQIFKYINVSKDIYNNRCKKAIELSEKYDWKIMTKQYLQLFRGELYD